MKTQEYVDINIGKAPTLMSVKSLNILLLLTYDNTMSSVDGTVVKITSKAEAEDLLDKKLITNSVYKYVSSFYQEGKGTIYVGKYGDNTKVARPSRADSIYNANCDTMIHLNMKDADIIKLDPDNLTIADFTDLNSDGLPNNIPKLFKSSPSDTDPNMIYADIDAQLVDIFANMSKYIKDTIKYEDSLINPINSALETYLIIKNKHPEIVFIIVDNNSKDLIPLVQEIQKSPYDSAMSIGVDNSNFSNDKLIVDDLADYVLKNKISNIAINYLQNNNLAITEFLMYIAGLISLWDFKIQTHQLQFQIVSGYSNDDILTDSFKQYLKTTLITFVEKLGENNILSVGQMADGTWFDDYLCLLQIRNNIFADLSNLLLTQQPFGGIPFSSGGINLIKAHIETPLKRFYSAGSIGGVETTLEYNHNKITISDDVGYIVLMPNINNIPKDEIQQRVLDGVKIFIVISSKIYFINIAINQVLGGK